MKYFFRSIIISVLILNGVLSAQVTFINNGQQLNRFIGRNVALGDFNNDGAIDAFVNNSDNFLIYFGDNHGQFIDGGQQLTRLSEIYGKPAIGDINKDGRLEVITGTTVWMNDGNGFFSPDTNLIESEIGEELGNSKLADLNGDGNLDLFSIANNAMRVLFNDGNGHFQDSGQKLGDGTIEGGSIAHLAIGDINGDGFIDAVTAGWRWNGSVSCPNRVWLNDGAGNFTETGQQLEEGQSHVHGLELGDLNGDGFPDLVMGIQDNSRSGRIYWNDGTGNFTGGANIGSRSGENVALVDFNGDGIPDVFVSQSTPPSRLWLNDGNGNLSDSGVRLGNNCYWDVAVGDFNNDGKPDAFTVGCIWNNNGLSPAPAVIWLNTRAKKVEVTYIANEGFLIAGPNGKIIIDGIFTEGWNSYPVPSGEVLNNLRTASPPFDNLTALLITHNHLDHINPAYTIEHLRNDSNTTIICPAQVHDLLKSTNGYSTISERVVEIPFHNSTPADTSVQNIQLKIISLPHSDDSAGDIQNLGYLFTLDGLKIFHCGDANSDDISDYQNTNLSEEKIDLAFLPKWFFDSGNAGREIINYLNPKNIIIMHVNSDRVNYYQNLINNLNGLPPVYILKTPLEIISFSDSSVVTSVEYEGNNNSIPGNFVLWNNYPNPFNPTTNIKFAITQPAHVKLTIYNLLGQKIRTLVNSFQNTGEYSLVWDSKNELNNYVPSGIYLLSLAANNNQIQKKMVLIR